MLYSYIAINDRRGAPLGLHFVMTGDGPVLILFRDPSKLADVQWYAEQMLVQEGKGNEQAIGEVDVSTADEFKRLAAESDPGFADSVEFLLDSDPYADEVIEAIREMRTDR
jgi:hypothetical protein